MGRVKESMMATLPPNSVCGHCKVKYAGNCDCREEGLSPCDACVSELVNQHGQPALCAYCDAVACTRAIEPADPDAGIPPLRCYDHCPGNSFC